MSETHAQMLEHQLHRRGIHGRVLEAFTNVDRAPFVPALYRESAYEDRALRIGHGQTISQPYMVALMLDALDFQGNEKVLEIGTGSGYQTALLSQLCKEVYTVERIEPLATGAEDLLLELGFKNILYKLGDGSLGWAEFAPYDRIVVAAACPALPEALLAQLGERGILAAPVGPPEGQELTLAKRERGRIGIRKDTGCTFVPLIGAQGFPAAS